MDFDDIDFSGEVARPTNPIEIFEALPRLPDTPNDLWRGQARALEEWHSARAKRDVLVSLNTGAGKTLVGLLIAQSLVHEGIENVVYACATIDLVEQTKREAERIGISCTTRVRQGFDNDLFETGRAFCITTYQALFNGHSAIVSRYFPGAVILDDAHVAESVMRSAYTLRLQGEQTAALQKAIVELFEPDFAALEKRGEFQDAVAGRYGKIVLAPARSVRERSARLRALLEEHGVQDGDLSYPFAHLRDKIDRCAVLFGYGCVEVTPPFLPALAHPIFERKIRRIYLSATLKYKADLARAFGRLPQHTVEPDSDAGNGERLILQSRLLDASKKEKKFGKELIKQLATTRKVVVAVPTYTDAEEWAEVGNPPTPDQFSAELEKFRKDPAGSFILVNRVDGIDLPHDTCRIMIAEGLPKGGSLLERFQWEFLRMRHFQAARIANRVVQLFGRINRGRSDFGTVLVSGEEFNSWLATERNLALLPDLLRKQIQLGAIVQERMEIKNDAKVTDIVDRVINRDKGWLDLYARFFGQVKVAERHVERTEIAENGLANAALAEAEFAQLCWDGDWGAARNVFEETIESTVQADEYLAGWHEFWLAACHDQEGDPEGALVAYRKARHRLGSNLYIPRGGIGGQDENAVALTPFAQALDRVVSLTAHKQFEKVFEKLRAAMTHLDGGTPGQMEAAYRALGEALGFISTRPDNDAGTGPDVLWDSPDNQCCLAIELKTDKKTPARYTKDDIGQGHNHLEWVAANFPDRKCLGLIYVGPEGVCTEEASPSKMMFQGTPSNAVVVRDRLFALISDLRKLLPLERPNAMKEAASLNQWSLAALVSELGPHDLKNGA